MNEDFPRIKRLPPYVFNIMSELKMTARRQGEDIVDLSMGNPDMPTPRHIVDKLIEAVQRPDTHRYSASKGIRRLREAICHWYFNRYGVVLDPDTEAIATIGSKEGIAHLASATLGQGDTVLVPNPSYPIHIYAPIIADAEIRSLPMTPEVDFLHALEESLKKGHERPKMVILNFPSNPTTECVDLPFFEKVIELAKQYHFWVVHDLAYADIVFEGKAPSILEVEGAKSCAVEFFTLSKSYAMPGWRVGFMVGAKPLVAALTRIKSYHDYGNFTPIQIAAITALEGPQACVAEICDIYRKRRDVLCEGLNQAGWPIEPPKATMFVWAPIPEPYRSMGSLHFAKKLLQEAKIAVSPGIGFGEYGDYAVRFALIENEQRIRQAMRNLRVMFRQNRPNKDPLCLPQ
jgi:alanine-synthesizing transaminase